MGLLPVFTNQKDTTQVSVLPCCLFGSNYYVGRPGGSTQVSFPIAMLPRVAASANDPIEIEIAAWSFGWIMHRRLWL